MPVGKVPDDLRGGRRGELDECRSNDNTGGHGFARMLEDVDYLEPVGASVVFVADLLDIVDGLYGVGSTPRNIDTQNQLGASGAHFGFFFPVSPEGRSAGFPRLRRNPFSRSFMEAPRTSLSLE